MNFNVDFDLFFEGQILLDILAERTTLDSTLEGAVCMIRAYYAVPTNTA